MKIAIIGGGAAGFFAAIAVKENFPDARVVIFEKTKTPLRKVKISGGGRCNVTNACKPKDLVAAYPRGGRQLKRLFNVFNNLDTMSWFESRGVPLVVQDDNCVFPVSQNSLSIINCFLRECKRLIIKIEVNRTVKALNPFNESIELEFAEAGISNQVFDKVIVTTGGSPKRSGLIWLENSGHIIEEPVPSLFAFDIPGDSVTDLTGIVLEKTMVSIPGTKFKANGALLITHRGMSGPAILKLSSLAAGYLSEHYYNCDLLVNWIGEKNSSIVATEIQQIATDYPRKKLINQRPYLLPERLWLHLLERCGLPADRKWSEIGKKGLNKLVTVLTVDIYRMQGRTPFKEEFVTCGGISFESVNINTLQSKVFPNLYFAGEVLNIDGITGGFNFQAAWTTGFVAGKLNT